MTEARKESAVEKLLKEWHRMGDDPNEEMPENNYGGMADEVEKAIAADKASGLLFDGRPERLAGDEEVPTWRCRVCNSIWKGYASGTATDTERKDRTNPGNISTEKITGQSDEK